MFKSCNFRNREVVNIDTAEKLGIVKDVEIDTENGSIKSLIVKKQNGLMPIIFGGELVIPWGNIVVTGKDLILVKFGGLMSP